MKNVCWLRKVSGFTLVEMSMVLLIVSLLLAGLVPRITSQLEQQRITETRKIMNDIRDALIGYAVIYGRLPCPTTTADPSSANYGMSDAACPPAGATSDGILPWKTLGVSEIDAWGSLRQNTADPWTGYWRYRVDRRFTAVFGLSLDFAVCSPPPSASDCLKVVDNSGNDLTSSTERPVAIVYSTGKDLVANGENASYSLTDAKYQSNPQNSAFDDLLIWISRPQLFNRMVAAGKLP